MKKNFFSLAIDQEDSIVYIESMKSMEAVLTLELSSIVKDGTISLEKTNQPNIYKLEVKDSGKAKKGEILGLLIEWLKARFESDFDTIGFNRACWLENRKWVSLNEDTCFAKFRFGALAI